MPATTRPRKPPYEGNYSVARRFTGDMATGVYSIGAVPSGSAMKMVRSVVNTAATDAGAFMTVGITGALTQLMASTVALVTATGTKMTSASSTLVLPVYTDNQELYVSWNPGVAGAAGAAADVHVDYNPRPFTTPG